jgi:hypothetical protein
LCWKTVSWLGPTPGRFSSVTRLTVYGGWQSGDRWGERQSNFLLKNNQPEVRCIGYDEIRLILISYKK